MFLISLHRLGSESLTRVEAQKKAVHYQRSHLTWERRTSQSIVVLFNFWERACHPLGIGKRTDQGLPLADGQNRRTEAPRRQEQLWSSQAAEPSL